MSRKLSKRAVALLDMIRALAAIYVVIHHVAVTRSWADGWGVIWRFGQEGVIVFFLLSGFVIFASEHDRATDNKGYFYRRVRRIYPPLLVAICVSTLVAYLNGNLYDEFKTDELLGSLFALQDISALKPGVLYDPYLGNDPLWSLSYEIVFYILFPVTLRAWLRWKKATNFAIGTISVLCFVIFSISPNHWLLICSYYQIWWCGAMIANAYLEKDKYRESLKIPIVFLACLCLCSAFFAYVDGFSGLGIHPFLEFRHFGVALILIFIALGPFGYFLARIALPFAAIFSPIASISYGLYILHFPLLVISDYSRSTLGLVLMSVVLLFMAFLSDNVMNRYLPKARKSSAKPVERPSFIGELKP